MYVFFSLYVILSIHIKLIELSKSVWLYLFCLLDF